MTATKCQYSRLLADASPGVTNDSRTLSFTFGSPNEARDGFKILKGAWQSPGHDGLKNFKRSPSFGWNHDFATLPPGKVTTIFEDGNGYLRGTVQFAETEFGEEVLQLFKGGYLSAVSVSWIPIQAKRATEKGRQPGALDFEKVELIEISAVLVGSDPEALVNARRAGMSLGAIETWARSASSDAKTRAQRYNAKNVLAKLSKTPPLNASPSADELIARTKRQVQARKLAGEWNSFGEWARAIALSNGGDVDSRLSRAPTGAGETVATAGGFTVPEGFASEIMTTLYKDRTSILRLFKNFEIPDGANTLKVPGVDETSRANGYRWGGVIADFLDEGLQQTISFAKVKDTEFAAEKIIALVPVSNELWADVPTLEDFLKTALTDEMAYQIERYALTSAGTGAGRPLSVLNSNALVTVAKTAGQSAGTVTALNLRSMRAALPVGSRQRAIWVISESVLELVETVEDLSYTPAGAANPDDLPRILGRPVIESDVLPAIGTPGDVLLIDPLWYGFAAKPIISAFSADVFFLGNQSVFRLTWRVDARPLVSAPITASDGAQRGAFIALAQR